MYRVQHTKQIWYKDSAFSDLYAQVFFLSRAHLLKKYIKNFSIVFVFSILNDFALSNLQNRNKTLNEKSSQ